MAKFLVEATYTSEGMQGLMRDKASGRHAAIKKAMASVGGKLDAMYFTLGERDVILICEAPDTISAAAVGIAASAAGMARTKTTEILTVADTDKALAKIVKYRAPGAK